MKKKLRREYLIGIIVIVSILFFILIISLNQEMFKVGISPLSFIEGRKNVDAITLTVSVINTGNYDLNCYVYDVTPTSFSSALIQSNKIVPKGGKVYWTSNKISTAQFEGLPTPDRFSASVSCSYNNGVELKTLSSQSNYIDLNIQPDTIQTLVQFRTNDTTYPKSGGGTIIGFVEQCVHTLILYKEKTRSCWATTTASCPARSGYVLLMDQSKNIPGAPIGSVGNVGCLYRDDTDFTDLVIAWKTISTSGTTCSVTGQWQTIVFDSQLSTQNEINNSGYSFNPPNEVQCT